MTDQSFIQNFNTATSKMEWVCVAKDDMRHEIAQATYPGMYMIRKEIKSILKL